MLLQLNIMQFPKRSRLSHFEFLRDQSVLVWIVDYDVTKTTAPNEIASVVIASMLGIAVEKAAP